jgi:hypothetical protein
MAIGILYYTISFAILIIMIIVLFAIRKWIVVNKDTKIIYLIMSLIGFALAMLFTIILITNECGIN